MDITIKQFKTGMYKLPKRFKEKWLKALRSGEYKQGETFLFNNLENSYCCLGIAGSICGLKNKSLSCGSLYTEEGGFSKYQIKKIEKVLPEILIGDFDNYIVARLANMNDSGRSFKQIANWIEKNL